MSEMSNECIGTRSPDTNDNSTQIVNVEALETVHKEHDTMECDKTIQSIDVEDPEIVTILIGNPGAGKSTILNTLAGNVIFKSGVSFGEGMTKQSEIKQSTIDGKWYCDTPGLDDAELRAEAAAEINRILVQVANNNYFLKLVFVVTLESGRIRSADKATIEVVLDALPDLSSKYGIIVNKVDPRLSEGISMKQNEFEVQLATKYKASHVCYVTKIDAANDRDNVLLENVQHLKEFVNSVPSFTFSSSEAVGKINYDKIGEMNRIFEAEMNELKKAHEKTMEEMSIEFQAKKEILQLNNSNNGI